MQHRTATRGGIHGHLTRRLIHFAFFLGLPLFYFIFFPALARYVGCSPQDILYVLMVLIIVLELLRIKMHWQLFAMREYEKKQVSAAAWGLLAIFFAVILSPSPGYAYALCWTAGIVDPVVGELKSRTSTALTYGIALFVAMFVWLLCWWCFGISMWSVMLCAPLALLFEYPSWHCIDDNFTMVMGPLLVLHIGIYFT